MAQTEAQKRRTNDAKNKREMKRTWESYEYLLRDDLERLDTRMYNMNGAARTVEVEQEFITAFVNEKMKEMVADIVKRREELVSKHGRMPLY